MWFAKLAALIASGENKGKPSIVEITSSKMVDGAGQNIKYKIAAERFEYPQFGPQPGVDDKGNSIALSDEQAQEGIDEAITDAGGKVRFLENYNNATRQASLNLGKNKIRLAESGEPSDVVDSGILASKEFTWAQTERLTNKEVREGAEQLAAIAGTLSPDELVKRLMALVGK